MNLAHTVHLFCLHILPVYKCFLSQIYFPDFNKAIKAVMDVARVITAGRNAPRKISQHLVLQLCGTHTHIAKMHLPLPCPLLPSKPPNQTYFSLANKPWIVLHHFVVPSSSFPLPHASDL